MDGAAGVLVIILGIALAVLMGLTIVTPYCTAAH
jgi:hypothetical protein